MRHPRGVPVLSLLCLAALASCGRRGASGVDKEVTTLGSVEVTARLTEIPGTFPPNDLYNYAYVFRYQVLEVHRGKLPQTEIFVAHYNPLKPRAAVQDDLSGRVGGNLDAFRAGDVHRMALEAPLDQFWMGGVIDHYFDKPGVRYWAVWSNLERR